MPPYENSASVRMLLHFLLKTTRQVLFERRVLDDRYPQSIMIAEHTLTFPRWNAFDLLDSADLEASRRAKLSLDQKGHQHRPLRVSVDAAASALLERREKEWGTR